MNNHNLDLELEEWQDNMYRVYDPSIPTDYYMDFRNKSYRSVAQNIVTLYRALDDYAEYNLYLYPLPTIHIQNAYTLHSMIDYSLRYCFRDTITQMDRLRIKNNQLYRTMEVQEQWNQNQ